MTPTLRDKREVTRWKGKTFYITVMCKILVLKIIGTVLKIEKRIHCSMNLSTLSSLSHFQTTPSLSDLVYIRKKTSVVWSYSSPHSSFTQFIDNLVRYIIVNPKGIVNVYLSVSTIPCSSGYWSHRPSMTVDPSDSTQP